MIGYKKRDFIISVTIREIMRKQPEVEQFTVDYGGQIIPVKLLRKKVKNINLRVKPQLNVTVSAPKHVPLQEIKDLIHKKAGWILKNFEHFTLERQDSSKLLFRSGDVIKYLGQNFILQINFTSAKEEVLADNEKVYLLVRENRDSAFKQKLLDSWYREEAKLLFPALLESIFPLLEGYEIAKPKITVRKMKTRWGSCSINSNKISLNVELVKTPLACIEYVLLHELIHFVHPNHGKAFYSFLEDLMPDWQERRNILKQEVLFDWTSC